MSVTTTENLNYYESPSSGRRWGWYADLSGGKVPATELYGNHSQSWYDEDIADVMALARTRPGYPLVMSVHQTSGSSGSSRYARAKDPRWTDDPRYEMTTRVLRDPANPKASAILITFREDRHEDGVDSH